METDSTLTCSPETPRPADLCHVGTQGTPGAPAVPARSTPGQANHRAHGGLSLGSEARAGGPNLKPEEVPRGIGAGVSVSGSTEGPRGESAGPRGKGVPVQGLRALQGLSARGGACGWCLDGADGGHRDWGLSVGPGVHAQRGPMPALSHQRASLARG